MPRALLTFRMKTLIIRFSVLAIVFAFTGQIMAQQRRNQTPQKQQLLNRLSVLLWKDASAEKISINLRIHSGSAFDPESKDGTAMLLTEVMFPNTGIYEDFADELGGSLSITADHDYIQIDITANKDKLVPVLEILASAVTSPQIDKETTGIAREAHLLQLATSSTDVKYLAGEETAARLFGDFPYGRSRFGSEESLQEIDFADLIYFKNRFFTADNATLSISGDIDTRYAYMAARRLLGAWQKGNRKIPSNFTLPESPDTAPLIVNIDAASWNTESYAVESAGRKSPDYFAARVFARILKTRLANDEYSNLDYEYFLLRGYYILIRSVSKLPSLSGEGPFASTANPLKTQLALPVGEGEFSAALAAEIADFKTRSRVNQWFDIDTYGLKSVDDEVSKLESVKLKNVTDLVTKLSKRPVVEVQVIPLEGNTPARLDDSEDPKDPQ